MADKTLDWPRVLKRLARRVTKTERTTSSIAECDTTNDET